MKKTVIMLVLALVYMGCLAKKFDKFPDGSDVPAWFNDSRKVDVSKLGRQYVITDFGVLRDSTIVQTGAIQKVIDMAADNGGGVVVVPEGTYMSGSLFFKPGTHLNIVKGGKLKGIDAISHYKIIKTRLEGQTIDYFAALVNADSCNGFTISGDGIIDGNGLRFYEEFWLRRKVNPKCTNLEALRPRLVYISNSDDVTVCGVNLIYSGFWTNHIYNCKRVKYLDVNIYAPDENPRGPSTDALDLDVCDDVLVSRCTMNVGDDAVCCKGGKGTWVDTIPGNGRVTRLIVDDCTFGRANAGVTFGSEAWDCSNVILSSCRFNDTSHMILFKMRPDTPQQYRDVLVEDCRGRVRNAIEIQRWTQFFNKVERDPMPPSGVTNVIIRDCDLVCTRDFYREAKGDYFTLRNFVFENITAVDPKGEFDTSNIIDCTVKNVKLSTDASLGANGAGIIDDRAN